MKHEWLSLQLASIDLHCLFADHCTQLRFVFSRSIWLASDEWGTQGSFIQLECLAISLESITIHTEVHTGHVPLAIWGLLCTIPKANHAQYN